MADFKKCVDALAKLDTKNMYNNDFFLTWEKTDDELQAVWAVAVVHYVHCVSAISLQKYSTVV